MPETVNEYRREQEELEKAGQSIAMLIETVERWELTFPKKYQYFYSRDFRKDMESFTYDKLPPPEELAQVMYWFALVWEEKLKKVSEEYRDPATVKQYVFLRDLGQVLEQKKQDLQEYSLTESEGYIAGIEKDIDSESYYWSAKNRAKAVMYNMLLMAFQKIKNEDLIGWVKE